MGEDAEQDKMLSYKFLVMGKSEGFLRPHLPALPSCPAEAAIPSIWNRSWQTMSCKGPDRKYVRQILNSAIVALEAIDNSWTNGHSSVPMELYLQN